MLIAAVIHFKSLDILWAAIRHPSQKLWQIEFASGFMSNFERVDILSSAIKNLSQKLRQLKFARSFYVQF